MNKQDTLFQSICAGDKDQVVSAVQEKIDNQANPLQVLNEIMIPAMREVGDQYSKFEIFLPEMLRSAKAMQFGIKVLEPLLIEQGYKSKAKLAIGTVEGDLHDIGKNIVVIMLKGAGYEVEDLGVNCNLGLYDQAISNGAQVMLFSALLTTTMPKMKQAVEHCKKNYPHIKVVVGGAPVSEEFADLIQADAYAEDASEATKVVDGFFG
ncbi:MAG: cobalamin-dependent protein [Desulfarculaceae bacterium]|nr:cobalamin-dependent protein [Desulfarculaceae bacterium]